MWSLYEAAVDYECGRKLTVYISADNVMSLDEDYNEDAASDTEVVEE